MFAAMVLAATTVADEGSTAFRAGNWEGSCVRSADGGCSEYQAVNSGPVTLRFVRTASAITVYVQADDCKRAQAGASINPAYTPPTMTHLIRGRVIMALMGCGSKLSPPQLLEEDIVELLLQTEDVTI